MRFRPSVRLRAAIPAIVSLLAAPSFAQTTPSQRPGCQPLDGRTRPDLIVTACNEAIRPGTLPRDALIQAFMNRGRAHFRIRDYSHAIHVFSEAIKLDPKLAAALAARGEAHMRNIAWELAMADFDEAIALDPALPGPYFTRGILHHNAGAFPRAEADFARFVELTRARPDPYAAIWLYLARARSKDARAVAELKTNAGSPATLAWPGPVVALLMGESTAERAMAAAAGTGERCEAPFYTGAWHVLRGETAEARAALARAVEQCPKTYLEYDAARAELRRLGR